MKRYGFAAIGIALILLATACAGAGGSLGPAPTGPTSPAPGTSEPPDGTPSPGRQVSYEVWFALGERLFMTKRTEEFDPGVAGLAMLALLGGPNAAEQAAGVFSSIPDSTRLLDVNLSEDGIVTVDLTGDIEEPSGTAAEVMRLAQVVYTLTQFDTVKGVEFRIDGQPIEQFGSHGLIIDQPATREDFDDQLPLILVESPLIGETVPNPVTVSGIANVFEATVSLRILDANGQEVARTFTTATCGTGCWGDYTVSVPYDVATAQQGIVEVYESSAKDGSPINVMQIPVMLTPAGS